jgi:phosphatidylserine/phosphatidylglycerophosphate/cardiolipin synthase-like enzyme
VTVAAGRASLARRLRLACAGVVLVAGLPSGAQARDERPAASAVTLAAVPAQALFSPWDDIEAAVVASLRAARRQVLVQAYSFTSRPIARALIEAKARGVDVRVTADAGETERIENGRIPELAAAGIAVFIEERYQSAHNKVMVIDAGTPGGTVITGSFNWTFAAQRRNAENVLILRDQPALAERYRMNWERHRADARPYSSR